MQCPYKNKNTCLFTNEICNNKFHTVCTIRYEKEILFSSLSQKQYQILHLYTHEGIKRTNTKAIEENPLPFRSLVRKGFLKNTDSDTFELRINVQTIKQLQKQIKERKKIKVMPC